MYPAAPEPVSEYLYSRQRSEMNVLEDESVCRCFGPAGPQPTSENVLRVPILDGDAKRHKVYTGLGIRCPTSSPRDRSCIPCTEVLVVGGYKQGERGSYSQVSVWSGVNCLRC